MFGQEIYEILSVIACRELGRSILANIALTVALRLKCFTFGF